MYCPCSSGFKPNLTPPPGGVLTKNLSIKWLPERLETLKFLTEHNFTIAVATNQGAIEEGLVSELEVIAVNREIVCQSVANGVDMWAIIFCPHGKNLNGRSCICRKPKPGMLLELVKRSGFKDSIPVVFFGDQTTDLIAAKEANIGIDGRLVNNNNFAISVRQWVDSI
jgi:D-glycero-D-manno-heptose 1,7-bisphosphate phosphatase